MLLKSPVLNLSTFLKLPHHPSTFVNASGPIKHLLPKTPITPQPPSCLTIHAMKKLQGRVVKDGNDKTVAVEVVRLAPHPKYKRRVRIKKRYQAHDPDNAFKAEPALGDRACFKVGDFVQLEKIRPISKTKTFLAVPVTARNAPKAVEEVPKELLELPLQSQEQSA